MLVLKIPNRMFSITIIQFSITFLVITHDVSTKPSSYFKTL